MKEKTNILVYHSLNDKICGSKYLNIFSATRTVVIHLNSQKRFNQIEISDHFFYQIRAALKGGEKPIYANECLNLKGVRINNTKIWIIERIEKGKQN